MINRLVSGGSSLNLGSPKKRSSSRPNSITPDPTNGNGDLSPELVPIVTLILSQSHRRYHEGIFMLYYDLNGEGKPADRQWKEVYGILTGNQLAYWDAANLAVFRNNPEAILQASSKPNYINFTDSVYNAMKSLPAEKQNLDNVIVVSTTLKNRFIIQFKSSKDLIDWYVALRLASYEYLSLQEAYTGALLSARGSRLSDIRTILAEKRFNHEDWVSIRYGSGMAWKRCYAVVEPSINKKKQFTPGRILFYESEQMKKKQLMAVVTNATSVVAVYPESPQLVDFLTMLKLEGFINFTSPSILTKVSKKSANDFKNTSLFIMPEAHSAVPGYDTLIRFLIPLLDSFGLYGRPTRLKADRVDLDSLLFGLPTLPHVHYLEPEDLLSLIARGDYFNWDSKTWVREIKTIMKGKLNQGYTGCGSTRGLVGAVSSLSSPTARAEPTFGNLKNFKTFAETNQSLGSIPSVISHEKEVVGLPNSVSPISATFNIPRDKGNMNNINSVMDQSVPTNSSNLAPEENHNAARESVQLAEIYQKYSDILSPSDQFNPDRMQLLNRSHEKFVESDLPEPVRIGNDIIGAYPKNNITSDDEDDEDDENKIDTRKIGMLRLDDGSQVDVGALGVPQYNDRNVSYASVKSPMTQYNEFNKQFKTTVDQDNDESRPQGKLLHENDYGYSDSDGSIPPSPPPHHLFPVKDNVEEATPLSLPKLRPNFNTVPLGTITPQEKRNGEDYLSIHSESGNIHNTVDSSPYSDTSDDLNKSNHNASPVANQGQSSHKPHYISLPHSNHNVPSILVEDANLKEYYNQNQNSTPSQSQRTNIELNQKYDQRQYQNQPLNPPQNQQSYSAPRQHSNKPQQYQPQKLYPGQNQYQQPPPQQQQQQQQYNRDFTSPTSTYSNQVPSPQQPYHKHQNDINLPSIPPQSKSYPNSLQFGYQKSSQAQQQQQFQQQPMNQKPRNYPPQQQYGAPQGNNYPPPQNHNYAPQQHQQQQHYRGPLPPQQSGGIPPNVYQQSKYPPRQQAQTGLPPSVMHQQPQRPRIQQNKSGANMRGYVPEQQGQYQYQAQVEMPQQRKPHRKPPTNTNSPYGPF